MYVMWLLLFYFVHQSLLVLLYADEKLSCASCGNTNWNR